MDSLLWPAHMYTTAKRKSANNSCHRSRLMPNLNCVPSNPSLYEKPITHGEHQALNYSLAEVMKIC